MEVDEQTDLKKKKKEPRVELHIKAQRAEQRRNMRMLCEVVLSHR